MTAEEIIAAFVQCLDLHITANNPASIQQSHYKSEFFKLFREAYNGNHIDVDARPRLTADGLREILEGARSSDKLVLPRWKSASTPEGKALMEKVLAMWHEWQYAWDQPRWDS